MESTIASAPRSELRAVDRVPQLLRTLAQPIVIGAAVSPGHHVVYPLSPFVVDGFRSEFRQAKRSCFHRSGSLVITSSPPRNGLFLSRRSYHGEGERESTQHRVPLVPSKAIMNSRGQGSSTESPSCLLHSMCATVWWAMSRWDVCSANAPEVIGEKEEGFDVENLRWLSRCGVRRSNWSVSATFCTESRYADGEGCSAALMMNRSRLDPVSQWAQSTVPMGRAESKTKPAVWCTDDARCG